MRWCRKRGVNASWSRPNRPTSRNWWVTALEYSPYKQSNIEKLVSYCPWILPIQTGQHRETGELLPLNTPHTNRLTLRNWWVTALEYSPYKQANIEKLVSYRPWILPIQTGQHRETGELPPLNTLHTNRPTSRNWWVTALEYSPFKQANIEKLVSYHPWILPPYQQAYIEKLVGYHPWILSIPTGLYWETGELPPLNTLLITGQHWETLKYV